MGIRRGWIDRKRCRFKRGQLGRLEKKGSKKWTECESILNPRGIKQVHTAIVVECEGEGEGDLLGGGKGVLRQRGNLTFDRVKDLRWRKNGDGSKCGQKRKRKEPKIRMKILRNQWKEESYI